LHLGSSAHNNPYWFAGMSLQSNLKLRLDPRRRNFAFKNDIAARDVGFDADEARVATHGDKVRHEEPARSANIDSAQKSDVCCHKEIISRVGRTRRFLVSDHESPERCLLPAGVCTTKTAREHIA
jgi:hypothetical protein